MLNHITVLLHSIALSVFTNALPEMPLESIDLESTNNRPFCQNLIFIDLGDLITSKMIRVDCVDAKQGYKWQCADCDYSSQYTTSVKRHIESKHVGSVIYQCDICQHRVPTKNALSVHKARNHVNDVLASADYC